MNPINHHNHEIEKGVLGRIIFEGEYLKVCDTLEPKHFNAPDHRDIYKAYQDLYLKFKDLPDLQDVVQAVRDNTGKNALNLLQACQQIGLTCWNVGEKAEMIVSLWMRRELQTLGKRLDTSPNKAQVLLEDATDTILGMKSVKEANATVSAAELIEEDAAQLEISMQYARSGEALPDAIYTGFSEIDAICGGWMTKEMVIIGGRPGMGKTTLAINIIKNIAQNGNPILFFSLDMARKRVLRNMAASIAEVDHSKLRTAMIDDIEHSKVLKAFETIKGYNFDLNETDYELEKIWLAAKRWRIENPDMPGVIFFDYVQKIHTRKIPASQMTASQTHIAYMLSLMGKELDCCIVALSQLSRAVEQRGGDKRPMLSDLRESGGWEQEAQTVLFPYRPEYYGFETDEEGNSTKGLCEVIPAKNRNGATNAPIKLQFIGKYAKFQNWGGYDISGFIPMSQATQMPPIEFNQSIMPPGHAGF